jgi:hypothetical protein
LNRLKRLLQKIVTNSISMKKTSEILLRMCRWLLKKQSLRRTLRSQSTRK